MIKQLAAAGFTLALFVAAAQAGPTTATFDFEGVPTTTNGGLTTLSQTNSGLTITVDRVGQPFDVANLSSKTGASGFGSSSLAPTPPGNNFFNVNFSQPVSSFSAQLGDFGTGFSDNLALTAFTGPNGTGTNLGSTSASLPLSSNTTFAFATISLNKSPIESVQLIGGTTAEPNSVFYDNFRATFTSQSGGGGTTGGGGSTGGGGTIGGGGAGSTVPLPAAAYVMPFGLALAWFAARKTRTV